MDTQAILEEAKKLLYGFLGAVATGAALAALNWLGAHIPSAIQFLSTVAVGYGATHIS